MSTRRRIDTRAHRFLRDIAGTICISLLCCGWLASPSLANDLHDGISTYTEDSIRSLDQLGDPEINFPFIELRAKSKVSAIVPPRVISPDYDVPAPPGVVVSPPSRGYMGNINSVVLLPGSNVFGDIVIVDRSVASKTQIILGRESYSSGLGTDVEVEGALDGADLLDDYPEDYPDDYPDAPSF